MWTLSFPTEFDSKSQILQGKRFPGFLVDFETLGEVDTDFAFLVFIIELVELFFINSTASPYMTGITSVT